MKIVYIAHQRASPTPEGRDDNREAAKDWLAWAAHQGVAPVASWIPLSERWTEEQGRSLGLTIDCELVRRCDELWLCGPVVSPGMQKEKETAELYGIPIRRYVTLNTKESDT